MSDTSEFCVTSVPTSSTLTFLNQEKAGEVGHIQFVYSQGLAFRLFFYSVFKV